MHYGIRSFPTILGFPWLLRALLTDHSVCQDSRINNKFEKNFFLVIKINANTVAWAVNAHLFGFFFYRIE